MRVVLAMVPFSSPFSPMLGASLVAAGLIPRGHQARVVDLALPALERLWSLECMDAGMEHLLGLLAHHERRDELSRSAARDYLNAAERILGADVARDNIQDALAFLRGHGDGNAYSSGLEYDRALNVMNAALRVSCAPFAPEHATLRTYRPPVPIKTIPDLLAHARRDASKALFGRTLLQDGPAQVLATWGRDPPDAVGISIAWAQQLGPAAMLSHGLRDAGFAGPIVWGGALMAHLGEDLARSTELRESHLVDAIIPIGGAAVLDAWLNARSQGMQDVPGVLVPGSGKSAEPLTVTDDVDDMPTPDFSNVPVKRYLSPRPVVPLLMSVGCYHHRCAFCDHFHSVQRYTPRKTDAVLRDVQRLHQELDCTDFYFVDDCSPPALMRQLAQSLKQWRGSGGPDIGWITECRAERLFIDDQELLSQVANGGCRMLLFGMESASNAVLQSMDKGVDREQLAAVIRAAHDAGIKTWTFYMLGFPTEGSADAQATHDFLVQHRDCIDVVAGGPFQVTRHSPIAQEPGRWGIQLDAAADKSRKKGPPPSSLELTIEHRGGKMTPLERDKRLHALQFDERLDRFRHPLVAEAHALFLSHAYYHGEKRIRENLPRVHGAVDWKALKNMQVSVEPGVELRYFRFPVSEDMLSRSGKTPAGHYGVISNLHFSGHVLHLTQPVASLVERCMEGTAGVEHRVQETMELGEGSEGEVMQAIIKLVEHGFLAVTASG